MVLQRLGVLEGMIQRLLDLEEARRKKLDLQESPRHFFFLVLSLVTVPVQHLPRHVSCTAEDGILDPFLEGGPITWCGQ